MGVDTLPRQPPGFLELLAHDLRCSLVSELAYSDHRVNELVRRLDQPMNLYYERVGFVHRGASASAHGGLAWHEMSLWLGG